MTERDQIMKLTTYAQRKWFFVWSKIPWSHGPSLGVPPAHLCFPSLLPFPSNLPTPPPHQEPWPLVGVCVCCHQRYCGPHCRATLYSLDPFSQYSHWSLWMEAPLLGLHSEAVYAPPCLLCVCVCVCVCVHVQLMYYIPLTFPPLCY